MNTHTKTLFTRLGAAWILPALIAGLGLMPAGRATAQPFATLHSFPVSVSGVNSDGAKPLAGLILSGNTLYGTAYIGGTNGNGAVFAVNTDSSGFTNLHSFTALAGPYPPTNSDGANPHGGLILSGNTLYGTAQAGGGSGVGTVFAINTDSSGFTNLHSFTATTGPNFTNSDGAHPYAVLILSGKTLYGTATLQGNSGYGTVFAVNTNGTGFTNFYNFSGGSDGAYPEGTLVLSGNTLYGTAEGGASPSANGTVFSLSLGSAAPLLTILPSGTNVILTWTNTASGFTLLFTTNLVAPVVWSTNSTAPVVISGQNTVTNPISGTQKFYR